MTPDELSRALRDHEREDAKRFGEVMGELGGISAKLDGLQEAVGRIDARQWDEHPSRAKTPTGVTVSRGGGLGTKATVSLIVAVTVLAEALLTALHR